MYFGDELVYENMIASGTVLWKGKIAPSDGGSIISLKQVKGDLSNVKGVKVYWSGGDPSNTIVTNVLKEDMNLAYQLKDVNYYNTQMVSLTWNKMSISFIATRLTNNYVPIITKITAL